MSLAISPGRHGQERFGRALYDRGHILLLGKKELAAASLDWTSIVNYHTDFRLTNLHILHMIVRTDSSITASYRSIDPLLVAHYAVPLIFRQQRYTAVTRREVEPREVIVSCLSSNTPRGFAHLTGTSLLVVGSSGPVPRNELYQLLVRSRPIWSQIPGSPSTVLYPYSCGNLCSIWEKGQIGSSDLLRTSSSVSSTVSPLLTWIGGSARNFDTSVDTLCTYSLY